MQGTALALLHSGDETCGCMYYIACWDTFRDDCTYHLLFKKWSTTESAILSVRSAFVLARSTHYGGTADQTGTGTYSCLAGHVLKTSYRVKFLRSRHLENPWHSQCFCSSILYLTRPRVAHGPSVKTGTSPCNEAKKWGPIVRWNAGRFHPKNWSQWSFWPSRAGLLLCLLTLQHAQHSCHCQGHWPSCHFLSHFLQRRVKGAAIPSTQLLRSMPWYSC